MSSGCLNKKGRVCCMGLNLPVNVSFLASSKDMTHPKLPCDFTLRIHLMIRPIVSKHSTL